MYSQEAAAWYAGHNVWNIATAARDLIQFGKHMKNPQEFEQFNFCQVDYGDPYPKVKQMDLAMLEKDWREM